jgi:hypothetical protein
MSINASGPDETSHLPGTRALIETTDENIREWAERLCHDYREQARHKSAAEL